MWCLIGFILSKTVARLSCCKVVSMPEEIFLEIMLLFCQETVFEIASSTDSGYPYKVDGASGISDFFAVVRAFFFFFGSGEANSPDSCSSTTFFFFFPFFLGGNGIFYIIFSIVSIV